MTPLYAASFQGQSRVVKILLQCGADQQIRDEDGINAEDEANNEETRAVFREFNENGLKNKIDLLKQAIEEENYDVAVIFIFRGAKLEGSDNFEKLIEITKRVIGSQGSDLSGISYKKLMEMYILPNPIREAIENHLIKNIEVQEEESGNTLLHVVAGTDNDKLLKFLLYNGASATQFIKNKYGKIPLEISKNNKYMFRLVLIDFLNYALKSPKFSTNEFQKQLGSGLNLFSLKKDFEGNKTLLEFSSEQGMIKGREEVIQLLIKIDHFRYQEAEEKKQSKRRIIKILRSGMKPSRGLSEAIGSVQEKYPWETGKIAVKCTLSVVHNILLGWSLYGSDVASDWFFYHDLTDEETRIASLIHIILPFFSAFFIFFTLLWFKILKFDRYLVFKLPLSPFTKFHKTVLECRTFVNNKNKEDPSYEQTNTRLIQELEDQKIITTVSMILESSMESSFQFYFQALFSLPTLVIAYLDIHEGKLSMQQLVNWKNLSIVLSFMSFAYASFNIR